MCEEAPAKRRAVSRPGSLAPLTVLAASAYVFWPASALARSLLRFVHAVPGAGSTDVLVTVGQQTINFGSIRFAQSTKFHSLRTGQFKWRLKSHAKVLATGSATVGEGSSTAVLLDKPSGISLGIYRDRRGEPGASLLRIIHAAPELGGPELELDSRVILHSLAFTHATSYLTVKPGAHSLAAMKPGSRTPLLSVSGVKLESNVAYSVVVVGTRGEQVRTVTVIDRGAPLTRRAPKALSAPSQRHFSAWVTVRPGDSLWKIARARVGAAASNHIVWNEVVAIWNENASRIGTGDPNLIFPGTRLHLPPR
jgi:hypothetical protein